MSIRFAMLMSAVAALTLPACTTHYVTKGEAQGPLVWFAHVEESAMGDARSRIIVCHRAGTPPCLRVRLEDASDRSAYMKWRKDAFVRDTTLHRKGPASIRPTPPPAQPPADEPTPSPATTPAPESEPPPSDATASD